MGAPIPPPYILLTDGTYILPANSFSLLAPPPVTPASPPPPPPTPQPQPTFIIPAPPPTQAPAYYYVKPAPPAPTPAFKFPPMPGAWPSDAKLPAGSFVVPATAPKVVPKKPEWKVLAPGETAPKGWSLWQF